ncbi:hypothetical protein [Moorena sp. SIO3A5]|uniref:hypothetical protein n=1 Tax=Moorena sp. SIO3A5 TaxID=2607822 RepID=UPI00031AA600|nr:hypothetical protein [Moorena sp. SIO3A5]
MPLASCLLSVAYCLLPLACSLLPAPCSLKPRTLCLTQLKTAINESKLDSSSINH